MQEKLCWSVMILNKITTWYTYLCATSLAWPDPLRAAAYRLGARRYKGLE